MGPRERQPFKSAVLLAALRSGMLSSVVEARGRNLNARDMSDHCSVDQDLVGRSMRPGTTSNLNVYSAHHEVPYIGLRNLCRYWD